MSFQSPKKFSLGGACLRQILDYKFGTTELWQPQFAATLGRRPILLQSSQPIDFMIPRRIFIASSISAVFATVLQGQDKKETKPATDAKTAKPAAKTEKVVKTDEEWKKLLTPEQYEVTRKHGTERAFKNAYNDNKKKGVYNCVGCGQALYSSEHKFDSGTGWPSFYQPVTKSAIGTTEDKKLFYTRVEVHCSKCDAHLGHVFDDADGTASVPKTPTGLRYCMNSAAMKFVEKK